jgi:hypothetical protein
MLRIKLNGIRGIQLNGIQLHYPRACLRSKPQNAYEFAEKKTIHDIWGIYNRAHRKFRPSTNYNSPKYGSGKI